MQLFLLLIGITIEAFETGETFVLSENLTNSTMLLNVKNQNETITMASKLANDSTFGYSNLSLSNEKKPNEAITMTSLLVTSDDDINYGSYKEGWWHRYLIGVGVSLILLVVMGGFICYLCK